ncbi:MAG: 1-deoxy-D-xylulose-5-phosphate reductoisomerase, partial [Bryobacterales bacterium]|nr:1-deoxy-D-xylulose-5-phosphate reductoisomerase [Bryobacterales bacterium]
MPIQYALTYPDRWEAPVQPLDWSSMGNWEFYPPDFRKFPLLKLAYQAMETGGSATATLNAADEIAVESFLRGEISYPRIAEVVEETLQQVPSRQPSSIAEVLDIDNQSRQVARSLARGELV